MSPRSAQIWTQGEVAIHLTQAKIVIAEGRDDVQLVEAVARQFDFENLQVLPFFGVDNLRGFLRALPSIDGFDQVRSLGIVCDAEQNAAARLQSVRDSLLTARLPTPHAPLTPSDGTPRVVLLINPHGSPSGSLDDVCIQSANADPAIQCIDSYVECLSQVGLALPANIGKTRAHAFIASRDRPDVSLGVALQRGYFPLTNAAFEPVRRLLAAL